jgi:hypothetical protein
MQTAGPHSSPWGVMDVLGSIIPGLTIILPGTAVALLGLLPAIRRLSASPYRVFLWEWAALIVPGMIWCGLLLSPLSRGRKTMGNFVESYILGCVMAVFGVVVRWGGARRVPPWFLRAGFVVDNCAAAVLVFWLVPGLPE